MDTINHRKSMTERALTVFNRSHGTKSRKEILEEFTDKVGLTPSSASTYYQKFLTESGVKRQLRSVGTSSRGRLPDETSKAGIARAIFRKLSKAGKARKDIIAAFVKQAKLTPNGASTYFQRMKAA